MADIIVFTPEQANAFATFPIGCPVWYFPPESSDGSTCKIIKGTISEVSYRGPQLGMMYQLDNKLHMEAVPEKLLGYAFQCPVIVSPPNGEGGTSFEKVFTAEEVKGEKNLERTK